MKKASLTPAQQAAFEWARQRLYQRVGLALGRMAAVACAMDRVWDVSLLHIEANYTQEFPDEQ